MDELPAPLSIAVIDLETGGLDPQNDPILQIGLVLGEVVPGRFEVDGEWSTMVRLHRPWSPYGARHIHGIRRHRLFFASPITRALNELAQRCGDRRIVAHNVAFDWGFLRHAAQQHHVALPTGDRLCTLELSRSLDPERSMSHRLADIAVRAGIEHSQAHDALADARTTALVLAHLLAEQAQR